MEIKKQLIQRQIAGETILVPVGKTVYDSNGLFVLTEVGAFIWDMLPDAQTEEDILKAILETYDVEDAVASADLAEFLDKLRTLEIL
jgi:hypothetical protein